MGEILWAKQLFKYFAWYKKHDLWEKSQEFNSDQHFVYRNGERLSLPSHSKILALPGIHLSQNYIIQAIVKGNYSYFCALLSSSEVESLKGTFPVSMLSGLLVDRWIDEKSLENYMSEPCHWYLITKDEAEEG